MGANQPMPIQPIAAGTSRLLSRTCTVTPAPIAKCRAPRSVAEMARTVDGSSKACRFLFRRANGLTRCWANLPSPSHRPSPAVEGFFAKLTNRRLKRGVFHSIVALQAAINRFVKEANQNPKPFRWTKDPDEIIAAVRRGQQALDSHH